jgi:hypothetical protein
MSGYKQPPKELFPLPPIVPFGPAHIPKQWDDPKIEPLEFLLAVMRSSDQPTDRRLEAAKAAAPYRHRGYRQLRLAQEKLRQMAKPK